MRLVWPARWYDGQTPVAREVTVVVSPHGVKAITDEGMAGEWGWHELRQPPRAQAGDPVRLEPEDTADAALLIDDEAFLDVIRELAPEQSGRFAPAIRRRKRQIAGIVAASILAAGALYFGIIPFLADRLAARVPVSWEEELGREVMETLTLGESRCQAPAAAAAVNGIVARLAAARPSPYRFDVTIVNGDMVNAFAGPGGKIVVYRGLLNATGSPEELAAVLAHEMEHVYGRHGTRIMLRQIPLKVLAASLTGDAGSANRVAGALGSLGMLRYQRVHEEEADAAGVELLVAAGIDPRGMPAFFRSLQNRTGDVPGLLRYLSTHPRTAERIARLDRLTAAAPAGEPLPNRSDWNRVRSSCN